MVLALVNSSFAASAPEKPRTLKDIDLIPTRVLQRSISPKFYQSLLISPIQGWIVVRAQLDGTKLEGMRVIHSELNGAYDELALKRAGEMQVAGNYTLSQLNRTSSILLHLLIYKTADGTLALSFPVLDGAGGNQWSYWGSARLAVLKDNGGWVDIKGPESLEGKGWAVRRGFENDIRISLKLENIPGAK